MDDDDYLMSLAPQSLLVVGKPGATSQTPENIFDRLLTLLRESGGASPVYNQVVPQIIVANTFMNGVPPHCYVTK